jgi:hypothetical protein
MAMLEMLRAAEFTEANPAPAPETPANPADPEAAKKKVGGDSRVVETSDE